MIKAVIFDMGGVLMRTFDQGPREALGQRYGLTINQLFEIVFTSESAKAAERGEKSDQEHWNWVFEKLGVPGEDQEGFVASWWAGDRMDYDLLDFINSLRPAYRTGLLSNAWLGTRQNITTHWGSLNPYFDIVVFSAEIGLRKPGHEFFNWLLTRLEVQPDEAVFVDDFSENIKAAKALGLKTVQFCSPDQAKEDVLKLLDHKLSRLDSLG